MRRVLAAVILALALLLLVSSCYNSQTRYATAVKPMMAPAFPAPAEEDAAAVSNVTLATGVVVVRKGSQQPDISFNVEIADTADSRNLGLMRRASLAEGAGMLFVFDSDVTRYFWMKNTLIPLDILYIATNGTIVDIQTMQPCAKEPCPTYPSKAKAQYALEINAGEAQEKGIAIGQTVVLPQ